MPIPAILARAVLLAALLFPALGAAPPPAHAQAAEPPAIQSGDIPPEEWSAMALGRTLTYRMGDDLWALERYERNSNRVRLQFRDGTCLEGTWEYAEPYYCFNWRANGTSCFRHVRRGDEILILEAPGRVESGAVQYMTGVSDTPLACGPAMTS